MTRQCLVRRASAHGWCEEVVWIPSQLAVLDKQVKDELGRVWTVTEVYDLRDLDKAPVVRRFSAAIS